MTSSSAPLLNPTLDTTRNTVSRKSHIYHNLPLDCISVILQYHIFKYQLDKCNNFNYSDSLEFLRDNQEYETDWGDLEWDFMALYGFNLHLCAEEPREGSEIDASEIIIPLLSECRNMATKPAFQYIQMSYFNVNDEVFQYLRGVRELVLTHVSGWSAEALVNLRGIEEFHVNGGYNDIPCSSFKNLRGIRALTINCSQYRMEEAKEMLENLRGIKYLRLRDGNHRANFIIRDNDLENLRGVQKLFIPEQENLHANAQVFSNLRGIQELDFNQHYGKYAVLPNDEFLKQLRGIKVLHLSDCRSISDAGMANLRGIHTLTADEATNISDSAFENLRGISKLRMKIWGFHKYTNVLTDKTFDNLVGAKDMEFRRYNMSGVTSRSLSRLKGVERFLLCGCTCPHLTEYVIKKLDEEEGVHITMIPHDTGIYSFIRV